MCHASQCPKIARVRYRRAVGSDRELDLAQTATAAASATVGATEPVGTTLGRYRLERELGAGGMGVVHAAFDPDLERRIALKVLRGATATREAKDRLMREARAMARLAHPNVVTVHEVGTAGGRDFVAMELIHGETLAEWLRSSKRPPVAIIDAFLAAGRGLAAAHAAGIVHRDFKPHNVLRSRDGRIVVTDFGLAREAETALPPALDLTLPVGQVSSTSSTASTPSSLAGLTVTGSLLGTPAYMAPEQWSGGAVTPATDQFAYCVALWEALAGERPYPGPTFDDLRSQVARGPMALDGSRIPRRIRRLLRRGLDPDPGRRWSSMDVLLAHLVRTQRRPGVAVAIAGGALVAAAALVVALRAGDAPAPACEPPERDVNAVWSPAIAAEVRAKTSEAHATVLAAAYQDWQTARTAACSAPPKVRQAQLSCLDGVLARFDALRQAYTRVPAASAEGIQGQLIDPEICRKPVAGDVPHLTLAPTPDVLAAYELYARSETDVKSDVEPAALASKPNTDPCARVIATIAFYAMSKDVPRARALMTDAMNAVDQCGDERLRADLLIRSIPYQRERPIIGPKGEAALKQAQIAAKRVMQPDVAAALAAQGIEPARQRRRWEEMFGLVDAEIAGYGARGLRVRQASAVNTRNSLRLVRSEPTDLEAIIADVQKWRPIAEANHKADLVARLDRQAALARFWLGDVPAAHAELTRLWRAMPRTEPGGTTREVRGEVVDVRGHAVAGASVALAFQLRADAVGIGSPVLNDSSLQITTTDDAGHFVITGAVQTGAIAAQLGDRRSIPVAIADHVRLVLAPTRSVSGKVDLQGMFHTRLYVFCSDADDLTGRFLIEAPVAADGSFVITGATVQTVRVGVMLKDEGELNEQLEFQTRPASPAPITDVRLALSSSARIVDVVVRSAVATSLEAAQVVLIPGKQQIRNVGDLVRFQVSGIRVHAATLAVGENVPNPVLDKIRSSDLVAHVEHVVAGELTACAIAFTGDLLDPQVWQRMQDHLSELALKCEPIGPDTAVVVIAVPPQPRFD